jgi:hypothetical protein
MTADILRRVGFDAFSQCTKFICCIGDCFVPTNDGWANQGKLGVSGKDRRS